MNKVLPAYLRPLDSLESETHITPPLSQYYLTQVLLPNLPPKKKKKFILPPTSTTIKTLESIQFYFMYTCIMPLTSDRIKFSISVMHIPHICFMADQHFQ